MRYIFTGKIKNGRLEINEKDYYNLFLQNNGGKVEITITSLREKRSPDQNKLYHLYLSEIAKHTGNSKYTLEKEVKKRFLPRGKESTTDLDSQEFASFLNDIADFGHEFGVVLPSSK